MCSFAISMCTCNESSNGKSKPGCFARLFRNNWCRFPPFSVPIFADRKSNPTGTPSNHRWTSQNWRRELYGLFRWPFCWSRDAFRILRGRRRDRAGSIDENDTLLQSDYSSTGFTVTGYAKAGLLSKASFSWVNPLLRIGADRTIDREDVPVLAPEHRALNLYERFNANWPRERKPFSVRCTLWKTFRVPVFRSAALAMCRVSVLFIGPLLIQSFVAVRSGNERFPTERVALVAVLILAKSVEVLSSHQYNFVCHKLGIQIKSTLITAVYRKGLRLSSSGRQSHGVGQIVNYMSVDVQNLADLSTYLNNLWIVPLQAIIGGWILFSVVGVSAIAGLFVMALTAWLEFVAARWLQTLQQKIMRGRDLRMKTTIEALSSMKIIKLQAWDKKFFERVLCARDAEFAGLSKFTYTVAFSIFISWLAPLTSCVAIFACSVLLGRGLKGSSALTIIATARVLQALLRLFPNTLLSINMALISLERLESFLWSDELEANDIIKLPQGSDTAICVENGSFKWDVHSGTTTLQNINLAIKQGSLVAVVGKVGQGKSSLLAALQGEISKVAGMVRTCGSTACVNQSAWIQNATIQDNILFGLPMNKERYYHALKASALFPDLTPLKFLDQTEIGERGVNLSGGQKQRVQLARALYQDSDIYFLEDIFSAVDAHTGSHLFRECVMGALQGKTVVLITHQVDFLPRADLILVMRDGKIVQSGKYEDLSRAGTDFGALVNAHSEAMDKVAEREDKGRNSPQDIDLDVDLVTLASNSQAWQIEESLDFQSHFQATGSHPDEDDAKVEVEKWPRRVVDEELKESGRVSWSVYWLYFTKAYGARTLIIVILLVQTVWQLLQIAGDYWVAFGASYTYDESLLANRFVGIYATLALSCGICVILRSILVGLLGLTTAQSFFLGMLRSIFHAPMSFFDCTPSGRILSRATTDQAAIDYGVPIMFGALLAVIFQILGMLIVTCRITWHITIMLIPLGFIYLKYQRYYFATSRELTRMDGITKAPVIHHFSETIAGCATIRCFQQQERFINVNVDHVDSNLKMDFHNSAAMEWVGLRVELMGVVVLSAFTLLLLFLPSTMLSPELVGLGLTYGLSLNQYLFDLLGLSCTLENKMISVERIEQYTELPSEAAGTALHTRPPSNWPRGGSIVMQNVKVRYRPEAPLILKGIFVVIEAGQKIGVVGRTGSGKTTLILALFRLVNLVEGQILIDGVDINNLELNNLRSKLSIIPQDPTLFDGTIRSNLDPLQEHSDYEIWQALEKCQLANNIRKLAGKLDSPVFANGENWSLGQKQLFCLGRVLLRHSHILILDEATASVDAQTDVVMQKIVRQEFAKSTVISVAHRIPSIINSEKVLVLDAGHLREYGSPSALLKKPNSYFSTLVEEYSSRAML